MHWRLTLMLAFGGWAALPSASHAWGPVGHQIVAEIAQRQLTARARAQVAKLLGPEVSLADIANYADDYRTSCRSSGPWHYVDIPLAAPSYEPARDCPVAHGGCVLSVLDRELRILADPTQPDRERQFALRFVVHLVGDLHQPLHATDDGDRGGNERKLRFRGGDSNLHKLWDVELIAATGRSKNSYVRYIVESVLPTQQHPLQQGSPLDWALEAREVARRWIYAKVPRAWAGQLELRDDYAQAVMNALDLQLLRAGMRLAMLLNRALLDAGPPVSAELVAQNHLCE